MPILIWFLFFPFSSYTPLIATQTAQSAVYVVVPPQRSTWQGYEALLPIGGCESTGDPDKAPRQFNNDGSILWGIDPATDQPVERDCGMFQINTWVHKDELAPGILTCAM
jgi:hypothetical protein